jgi:hypothetical protein
VLVSAGVTAPLGLPLLPPQTTARYTETFGLGSYEEGVTAELPQYFADRFGWQELTMAVVWVYRQLPRRIRKRRLSSPVITVRLAPSTSTDEIMAWQSPSAATTTTGCGDRETGPGRC